MLFRRLFFVLLVVGMSGCVESQLQLSPESRIPDWFDIPQGRPRSDFKVTAAYEGTASDRKLVFKLYDDDHVFALQKLSTRGGDNIQSVHLARPGDGFPEGYPKYKIITINGITDVLEHRKKEAIFYTTDDPAVRKELGVVQ
ncbi:MAG: hypothetical protein DRR42_13720 [Gammaproteobacteria bacterium]|nr:MAG: hypothetical protein DRR42_13720 [Gammaproteobacteria bacterium]